MISFCLDIIQSGKSKGIKGIQRGVLAKSKLVVTFFPWLFLDIFQWGEGGEGLTKASTCNGTFVLEFKHFLKTGGEWPTKIQYVFVFKCKYFVVFFLLFLFFFFSYWIGPLCQIGLLVAMSIFLSICLYIPLPFNFFEALSLALKIKWSVQSLSLVNPPSRLPYFPPCLFFRGGG